jgi:hypothetical protein
MIFRFHVSGMEDNYVSRRNYDVHYFEVFEIEADDVGDALNELINRSGMWETLDMDRSFKIEFRPPLPSVEDHPGYDGDK